MNNGSSYYEWFWKRFTCNVRFFLLLQESTYVLKATNNIVSPIPNSQSWILKVPNSLYRYWNLRSTYSFILNFAPVWVLIKIFKLADRMRSMRTNGASRNRDWPGQKCLIYRLCRTSLKTEVPMVCICT